MKNLIVNGSIIGQITENKEEGKRYIKVMGQLENKVNVLGVMLLADDRHIDLNVDEDVFSGIMEINIDDEIKTLIIRGYTSEKYQDVFLSQSILN